MSEGRMRIDRFLWFARIVSARKFAQALASAGHMRIGGHPVDRSAAPVKVGDIVTFATHGGTVRVLRIETLPMRRGPCAEARACYTDMSATIDGRARES